MFLHVKEARHLHGYVLWLRFNDGVEGEIDLTNELQGEVFAPLQDVELFKRFRVDPEMNPWFGKTSPISPRNSCMKTCVC